MGMMQTWERGDTTVLTLFANNIDFYFSFQIGISLAIALYGIVLSVKNIRRSQSKQNTKTQNYKHSLEDLSKKRGHMPSWLFLITYLISCTGYIVVSGFLIGWHPGVMIVLFFFGFIYTPLISYVTARLEGMAGQVIEIPFIKELAFIISGYQGVKIWFYHSCQTMGWVVNYKQAELLGYKFTSIWKSQVFLFHNNCIDAFIFELYMGGLQIPSAVYPFTMEIWDLMPKMHVCCIPQSENTAVFKALGMDASLQDLVLPLF